MPSDAKHNLCSGMLQRCARVLSGVRSVAQDEHTFCLPADIQHVIAYAAAYFAHKGSLACDRKHSGITKAPICA